jgi:trans-L-3-hydroxyproline dehydratase
MQSKFNKNVHWNPQQGWLTIDTIDAHTEGEPLRIILNGFPDLHEFNILQKRQTIKKNLDHLRKALMWEPRGHSDMYGCIITQPFLPDSDFGVIFTHNEGYSTMCGHGIIAVTTVVLETGMIPMTSPVTSIKIDTPAGLVTANARIKNNQVSSVYFYNVPSFVYALDQTIEVPGLGTVQYDIAFGGAFYAFVDLEKNQLNLEITPRYYRSLIKKGMQIKHAVIKQNKIEHPFESDLSFLYGTIFTGKPKDKNHFSRNTCIFANGELDRSPTGTGVSARMALFNDRNEVKNNEPVIIESILGTTFSGKIIKETKFGNFNAVIPEVEGTAHITGKHQFIIDPSDPLKEGFILR